MYGPFTIARPRLLHEADHGEGDGGVEDQVGDGDPVLQTRPVVHGHHHDVLDAAAGGDEDPKDKEAAVPQLRAEDEEEGADNAEEAVEDTVLNDGSDADILALALVALGVYLLGVFDDVGDGDNGGDDELDQTDEEDGLLEGQAAAGLDTGSAAHPDSRCLQI